MINKERFGISLDKKIVELMDDAMKRNNSKSRSEFISVAIEFYIASMNSQATSRVLTPALESVIGAKIDVTENNLSRIVFKQGVEIAMLEHLMALAYRIEPDLLADIRKTCIEDVAKLNGNFESIVEMENERKRFGKDKIFLKEDE